MGRRLSVVTSRVTRRYAAPNYSSSRPGTAHAPPASAPKGTVRGEAGMEPRHRMFPQEAERPPRRTAAPLVRLSLAESIGVARWRPPRARSPRRRRPEAPSRPDHARFAPRYAAPPCRARVEPLPLVTMLGAVRIEPTRRHTLGLDAENAYSVVRASDHAARSLHDALLTASSAAS